MTIHGGALKALGEDRVGGYLILWGSPNQTDLHKEYFSSRTDLALDLYNQRPLLYHHGLDGAVKTLKVGEIDTLKADNEGLWMEAQLDLRKKYVGAIMKLVKRGVLGLSSGAMPQLVEQDNDGHIRRWPLIEGSLTPTPAEPRIVAEAIKSIELALAAETSDTGASGAALAAAVKADHAEAEVSNRQAVVQGALKMDEMLTKLLAALEAAGVTLTDEQRQAVLAQFQQQQDAGMEGAMLSAPEVTAIRAYLETGEGDAPEAAGRVMATLSGIARGLKAQNGLSALARTANPRVTGGYSPSPAGNVRVSSKYDALTAEDMSYASMLLSGNPKNQIAPAFFKALADKVDRGEAKAPSHAALKAWREGAPALKDNELDHSTQSSYGDEWVPTLWESSLWDKMRIDNVIASSIDFIDMPSTPYELPIESADPTVYLVPETTNESQLLISGSGSPIPDSKIGTGKVTLTAKKLALRVGYSAELDEDSIIPIAPQFRKQADRAIADSVDNVILNGDDDATANTNINLKDGTPGATAKYLAFDGLRHLPLITTTANVVDALNVSPTLALIRQTRFKLANAYALRPSDLRIVTSAEVYAKLLSMPEFITMDKAGPQATAFSGQVGTIDGMPVLVSAEYGLAQATGLINASSNTFGSLTIYAPYAWKGGYRRRVRVTPEFWAATDSYQLTATVRLALTKLDADCSAILVNLAV